jgi:hypothetical protein
MISWSIMKTLLVKVCDTSVYKLECENNQTSSEQIPVHLFESLSDPLANQSVTSLD